MPSPLPGMNPFFEQAAHWADFHSKFLVTLRRQLVPRIGSDYIVQLEKHDYIHDFPPVPRRLPGRPDISVVRSRPPNGGPLNLVVFDASAEVQLPFQDVEQVAFLEIAIAKDGSLSR